MIENQVTALGAEFN